MTSTTSQSPFSFESNEPFSFSSKIKIYKPILLQGKKAYQCRFPQCEKIFRFKSDMERHMIVHSDNKPFICPDPTCNKAFKRADALKNHIQSHNNHYNYVCSFPGCNAQFRKKAILQYHLTKHLPSQNFSCSSPGCKETFLTFKNLRNHQRSGCSPDIAFSDDEKQSKPAQSSAGDDLELFSLDFDQNMFQQPEIQKEISISSPSPSLSLSLPKKLIHTEKEEGTPAVKLPAQLKEILEARFKASGDTDSSSMKIQSLLHTTYKKLKEENQELLQKIFSKLKKENDELKEKLATVLSQCGDEIVP